MESARWRSGSLCGISRRLRKKRMSEGVIGRVRRSLGSAALEYSHDRIAKKSAPVSRMARALRSGVLA
eukprot:13347498-Ditylum_brightwellii.AAC.1